jgi:hypothetical protein
VSLGIILIVLSARMRWMPEDPSYTTYRGRARMILLETLIHLPLLLFALAVDHFVNMGQLAAFNVIPR